MLEEKEKEYEQKILESGLFDSKYYLKTYRDVRVALVSPLEHFIKFGLKEDRKPNEDFDPVWYREFYEDVKQDGVFPFIHYISHGIKKNRFINEAEKNEYEHLKKSGFDIEFYKNTYEDLQQVDDEFDFLLHYIRYGKREGREICRINESQVEEKTISDTAALVKETIFDTQYYLENNSDVGEAGMDPEDHYYQYGEKEGRKPNALFDPIFYYQLNADVRVNGLSAFKHFCESGYKEGRKAKQDIQRKISYSEKALLFVGHDGIQAGAQVVLLEIIKWFSTHTTRKIKLVLLDYGPLVSEYAKYAEVYVINNAIVDDITFLNNFIYEDFEFMYLSTVVSGRFFQILNEYNINLNIPVIANIHEMEKVLNIYLDELELLKINTKHWISGSADTTKDLIEKFNINKDKITTVPAFINPIVKQEDESNKLKVTVRRELGIDEDTFVVVGCGTVYWRKGPDIFVETAKKLKALVSKKIQFIWIGNGEDKEKIESELTEVENQYISFIGHKDNAEMLIAAGDVFFLSSREDPFPLVVLLAAQHHIPTICFEETTGISQFVQNDAGFSLKEINTNLAASAIQEFIENKELLEHKGEVAFNRVFESYTVEKKMLEIYDVILKTTSYKPSVSVIVPFYNHENFLKERIESILNQSIQDIEVILLDDCSPDNSVVVAKEYLKDKRVSLYLNEKNSGTPFKQWKKGIGLAQSEVIWIAEGDDSCSSNFLETLLPYFEDKLINIVSSKVEMINEHSEVQPNAFQEYFRSAHPHKFDSNYLRSGLEEVNEQLGAISTLINASGLLIRKSSFGDMLDKAEDFKMCGDWLIYLECLQNAKIAHDINAINYFRRHSASQVKQIEGSEIYFNERFEITKYVFEKFPTTKSIMIKAFNAVEEEWNRFKEKNKHLAFQDVYNKDLLVNIRKENLNNRMPSLAVVTSDLAPGGGQMFSIRLANAWKKAGGNVILLNVNIYPSHPQVIKKVNSDVPIFDVSKIKLQDVLKTFDIDIVHSSLWWADKYVHENILGLPTKTKWVVTMHGCYETLISDLNIDRNFLEYFKKMQYEVDHWVYIAEKNKKAFKSIEHFPMNFSKVLNGYEQVVPKANISKNSIGVRDDTFLFCLVSRAMESKGWIAACEAIERLNDDGYKVDLLLIGEGESLEVVKNNYKFDYIHTTGQIPNVEDYISVIDVGLLPSYFVGESMPLVLIEYMAQGKPIIATNIGEIVDMTQDAKGSASLIIELEEGKVSVDDLYSAMLKIYEDESLYNELSYNSSRLFNRFDMKHMISEYNKIYIGLMNEK